jgi:D-beta-D-heptose 7-phosphate kinase/D-beta-D-heptose 1-phosphate adenosyltransferase
MINSILVVGDIILDHYIYGNCERISPEAPVAILDYKSQDWKLGGAANVANNLSKRKSNVSLMGIIGDDSEGKQIKGILKKSNINQFLLESKTRQTTTKSRVISGSQQMLRIDKEDKYSISSNEEAYFVDCLKDNIYRFSLIIISDYNKGFLTDNLVNKIIQLGKSADIKVLVDPKNPPFKKFHGAFLIKPNRKEAFLETGISIRDNESLLLASKLIKINTNCNVVVITLAEDGVGFVKDDELVMLPTQAIDVYDVTGAGDTFIACLAFCLAKGKSLLDACVFANHAAGIVISKQGCMPIELNEIKHLL